MADNHFPLRDRSQERWPRHDSGGEIQYLLRAEEQLLHSMSARVPLADMLHKICDALNSEIGNMISLISLKNDDATGLAVIANSAELFGLHKFCSARVVGGRVTNCLDLWRCTLANLAARSSARFG